MVNNKWYVQIHPERNNKIITKLTCEVVKVGSPTGICDCLSAQIELSDSLFNIAVNIN